MALVALQVVQAMQGARGFKARVPAAAPILREVIPVVAVVNVASHTQYAIVLMDKGGMEEARRAALIRARSALAVRVELAEEVPEATEVV